MGLFLPGANACTLAGLCLALVVSAWLKSTEGYLVRGRLAAFLLFLSLESSALIYVGIGVGLIVGASILFLGQNNTQAALLGSLVVGGAFGALVSALQRRWEPRVKWSLVSVCIAAIAFGGYLI